MPSVPPPSRRRVLQLAGVTALTLLAGCTGDDDGPDTPGAKSNEPDPDLELLARAVAEKQDLLAAYEATLDTYTGLTIRLRPLQVDHRAHLGALTRVQEQKAGPALATTPGPSASASPIGSAVPASTGAAVEALAKAELAAAGRRIGQCESARDSELARLLASIGGCEAAHTAMLRAERPT